jgi:pimeloyl-ACP methyl ester carboxylesterase
MNELDKKNTSNKNENVLFLNGWMENSDTWKPIIKGFEKEFNCFTLEFPGFGVFPAPKKTWDISDYAVWVQGEIDRLEIKEVTVVGHSFGGRVAIVLCSKDSRIKKVVLYSTPGFEEPKSTKTKLLQSAIKMSDRIGVKKERIPFSNYLSDKFRSSDYKTAGSMREIFISAINFNLSPFMKEIKIPTLLLWGENDKESSLATANRMQSTIRNAELKIIPEAGHFAHLDNPNLFCGIIRRFINEKNV